MSKGLCLPLSYPVATTPTPHSYDPCMPCYKVVIHTLFPRIQNLVCIAMHHPYPRHGIHLMPARTLLSRTITAKPPSPRAHHGSIAFGTHSRVHCTSCCAGSPMGAGRTWQLAGCLATTGCFPSFLLLPEEPVDGQDGEQRDERDHPAAHAAVLVPGPGEVLALWVAHQGGARIAVGHLALGAEDDQAGYAQHLIAPAQAGAARLVAVPRQREPRHVLQVVVLKLLLVVVCADEHHLHGLVLG
mmetsp:Transcript_37675/g.95226  ORF Transcript_37675/g.95226 Transcript_37675/m.95226 type:complete len:243 (-) Transcript_37675:331-1059(-)